VVAVVTPRPAAAPGVIPEPEVPHDSPYYAPSPTVEEFIYAVAGGPATEFRLLILRASRGEGKTVGAISVTRSGGTVAAPTVTVNEVY